MYGIHTMLIKRSFLELEKEDTQHKLSHIAAAIQNEKEKLASVVNFVVDEEISEKMVQTIFISFDIDILLYSNEKSFLYYKKDIKDSIQFYNSEKDSSLIPIIKIYDDILFLNDAPYLTVSSTAAEELKKGNLSLTAGKKLDSTFIKDFIETENAVTKILFYDDVQKVIPLFAGNDNTLFSMIKEKELYGYILFSGDLKNPKGIIEVIFPRTIYEQGESIFRFTIMLIVLIGIFVYIVIMLFFELTVLTNIKDLGNQVNYIADTEDETAQIQVKVRDEIGLLAQKINRMLRIKRIADKALRESEHFHKVIFESSDDAFVIVDEKEEAIYSNPKFHKLLGFSSNDLSDKNYYELVYEKKENFSSILSSNEIVFPVETRLKRKEGTPVDVEVAVSSIIIKNSPCRLERYTDLSDKKKAEIKIRESHERFLSIFQSAEDIILTVDKNGIVQSINNFGVSYSGKQIEDIEGNHIKEVFELKEDHLLLKMINEVITNGNKRVDEISLKEKNYLNIAVTRMIDNTSGESVALVIGRDITTIKELEEEARKNQLQLQQADKLASLGLLVAGVAHEINNPVSFISFNVPYIEQYFNEIFPLLDAHAVNNPGYKIANVDYKLFKKDIKDMLSDLYEGAQRITGIVADLKTFSKMETENENTFVKVDEIVNSTMRLLQPAIKKKSASIKFETEKDYSIKGNKQKIGQVIINLLTNSLDAVEEGKGEIIVSVNKKKNNLLISVKDNGAGISKKDAQMIFDPFFTTKSFTGGTGLGLSVAKSITENMGYSLNFESKLGTGTTFYITIPEESFK